MSDFLTEFPPGPLDTYRHKATFDWKRLKIHTFGSDVLAYQDRIWKVFVNDPLFKKSPLSLPLDQQRDITFKRFTRLHSLGLLDRNEFLAEPWKNQTLSDCLCAYDKSLALTALLQTAVFYYSVVFLGTDRHMKILEDCDNLKIVGCFALTELSHGSNVQNMETTCTFDEISKDLVLNTTNIGATKVWAGNLGSCATHAVVFAKLIAGKPPKDLGLHPILVQIRCQKTLRPMPGVQLGDMGEKIGLNGLANGFAVFKNMRVPRQNLLNKFGDLTPDGIYVPAGKSVANGDASESRHASNFSSLSMGRIGIICNAAQYLRCCVTIAVRYAACRRQFGPSNCKEETHIIEYPLHQWRLFPYLAGAYVWTVVSKRLHVEFINFVFKSRFDPKSPDLPALGRELHALSCAGKSLSTWLSMDAVQECREACGGHGYLRAARLGSLRTYIDPTLTYEGDNNVLLQQTANYLTAFDKQLNGAGKFTSPLGTIDFLQRTDRILSDVFHENDLRQKSCTEIALTAYKFLCCYLFRECLKKLTAEISKKPNDLFAARNASQVFLCHTLAQVFMEHVYLEWYWQYVTDETPADLKNVLGKTSDLFALWCLDKRLATLYMSGYCTDAIFGNFVRTNIVRLCGELKNEAVSLADVLAPPDHVLESVLGNSDGKIYENIFASFVPETESPMSSKL